jgi:hypothetical protein
LKKINEMETQCLEIAIGISLIWMMIQGFAFLFWGASAGIIYPDFLRVFDSVAMIVYFSYVFIFIKKREGYIKPTHILVLMNLVFMGWIKLVMLALFYAIVGFLLELTSGGLESNMFKYAFSEFINQFLIPLRMVDLTVIFIVMIFFIAFYFMTFTYPKIKANNKEGKWYALKKSISVMKGEGSLEYINKMESRHLNVAIKLSFLWMTATAYAFWIRSDKAEIIYPESLRVFDSVAMIVYFSYFFIFIKKRKGITQETPILFLLNLVFLGWIKLVMLGVYSTVIRFFSELSKSGLESNMLKDVFNRFLNIFLERWMMVDLRMILLIVMFFIAFFFMTFIYPEINVEDKKVKKLRGFTSEYTFNTNNDKKHMYSKNTEESNYKKPKKKSNYRDIRK